VPSKYPQRRTVDDQQGRKRGSSLHASGLIAPPFAIASANDLCERLKVHRSSGVRLIPSRSCHRLVVHSRIDVPGFHLRGRSHRNGDERV